jgi:hypothetical protein
MVDRDLNFKIRQARARGKTYGQIQLEFHVGRSRIAKVLKAGSSTGLYGTTVFTSLLNGESHYISENSPIENQNAPDNFESNILNSPGITFIESESIDPDPSGGFLQDLSDSLIPRRNLSIKKKSLLSPWGKILIVLICAALLILFLNKVREEALGYE